MSYHISGLTNAISAALQIGETIGKSKLYLVEPGYVVAIDEKTGQYFYLKTSLFIDRAMLLHEASKQVLRQSLRRMYQKKDVKNHEYFKYLDEKPKLVDITPEGIELNRTKQLSLSVDPQILPSKESIRLRMQLNDMLDFDVFPPPDLILEHQQVRDLYKEYHDFRDRFRKKSGVFSDLYMKKNEEGEGLLLVSHVKRFETWRETEIPATKYPEDWMAMPPKMLRAIRAATVLAPYCTYYFYEDEDFLHGMMKQGGMLLGRMKVAKKKLPLVSESVIRIVEEET